MIRNIRKSNRVKRFGKMAVRDPLFQVEFEHMKLGRLRFGRSYFFGGGLRLRPSLARWSNCTNVPFICSPPKRIPGPLKLKTLYVSVPLPEPWGGEVS